MVCKVCKNSSRNRWSSEMVDTIGTSLCLAIQKFSNQKSNIHNNIKYNSDGRYRWITSKQIKIKHSISSKLRAFYWFNSYDVNSFELQRWRNYICRSPWFLLDSCCRCLKNELNFKEIIHFFTWFSTYLKSSFQFY